MYFARGNSLLFQWENIIKLEEKIVKLYRILTLNCGEKTFKKTLSHNQGGWGGSK